jgi:hypothetical protein
MVRHWSADQIGPFSWFGLSHIKEADDPIRLGCVPGSNAGPRRIKGTYGSEDPAPVRNKEPSRNARPHYSDLPEAPLPEKSNA